MSDIRNKAKDIIMDGILRSTLNDQNKTVGEIAERTLNQLLEMGMLLPPCKVGDTVYWLDTVNHIKPFEVGGFDIRFRDKEGNCYLGSWDNGIYPTENLAKAQVEYNRRTECEKCFKNGIKGGYLVGCEKGWECSKKSFREEFGDEWVRQVTQPKVTDRDYSLGYEYRRCKTCFMRKLEKGEFCESNTCVYNTQKILHSEKWEKEFKEKENT